MAGSPELHYSTLVESLTVIKTNPNFSTSLGFTESLAQAIEISYQPFSRTANHSRIGPERFGGKLSIVYMPPSPSQWSNGIVIEEFTASFMFFMATEWLDWYIRPKMVKRYNLDLGLFVRERTYCSLSLKVSLKTYLPIKNTPLSGYGK